MNSFVGLDWGSHRIGVAVGESLLGVATPHSVIEKKDKQKVLLKLQEAVGENQANVIVVGLPKTLKGEEGIAAENIKKEVAWYQEQIDCEWVYWDERLSTAEVEKVLIDADVRRDKRKQVRDAMAAQRILQNYIDANVKRERNWNDEG